MPLLMPDIVRRWTNLLLPSTMKIFHPLKEVDSAAKA